MQSSNDAPPMGEDVNGATTHDGTLINNKAIMTNTKIKLYSTLDHTSNKYKQIVIDHEVGHALGFDHDNRKLNNGKRFKNYHLTMNAYNIKKTYKLGGIEQRTLADHYGIQPSNGYLNTNC